MNCLEIFGFCLAAVILFSSEYTLAVSKTSQTGRGALSAGQHSSSTTGKNSSLGSSLGLSSLQGLTQGLGLGLRRRRSVNNISNPKTSGKASNCTCPPTQDPVCASNGQTYSNKCMLQCAQQMLNKMMKTDKNYKKSARAPALKFVKKGSCTITSAAASGQEMITGIEAGEVEHNVNEPLTEPGYVPKMMPMSRTTSKLTH